VHLNKHILDYRKKQTGTLRISENNYYKWWRHELRHRGPPVRTATGPLPFNPALLLVLIFIGSWSHAAENRSTGCWRRCSEDANSNKSSAKANFWSCTSEHRHSRPIGCDRLSNLIKEWVVAAHTPVGVQHPQWTVLTLC